MSLLWPPARRSILALLALAASALPAVAQESRLRAIDIFDAALAKFEADRAALRQWQYHQTLTTHQFNSRGQVVAKGTWKSIVRPGDPSPLEYTAKSMEGQLSFFKAEEQESPSAGQPSQRSPQSAASEKNQAESAVEAVRKYNLRDRYLWERLPDESVAGESAYVLSFSPKPKQNTNSREERFFGLLAGRLWISRADSTVLKAEAALQSPSQLFWILARVTTFEVRYQLKSVSTGPRFLRPSKATAKTVVSFPFSSVRQQHWLTAGSFEPRSPRGSASKSAAAAKPGSVDR
ncbi:MAG: hypothetical protein H0U43_08230 [Chthoniobacterales bacterium]|nr:hypothetical protein [Chthoniobacterales bacterium]